MKQPDQDLPIDDALIDRIVDGGMSPEELRGALDGSSAIRPAGSAAWSRFSKPRF